VELRLFGLALFALAFRTRLPDRHDRSFPGPALGFFNCNEAPGDGIPSPFVYLGHESSFSMADSIMNNSPESIQTRNRLNADENFGHEKATAQPGLRRLGVRGNLAPIAIGPPGLILRMESPGLSEKFASPF